MFASKCALDITLDIRISPYILDVCTPFDSTMEDCAKGQL
jgi:hypothetical protein